MNIKTLGCYITTRSIQNNIQPYYGLAAPPDNSRYITGDIRWNFTTQKHQVFDGQYWHDLNQETYIGLSEETSQVLAWARKKMLADAEQEKLEAQHPGLKQAREHYETMLNLVKNHEITEEK